MHSRKTSLFRFSRELPPHLPLAVRSVGEYDMVPGSQIEPPIRKDFCQVFWTEHGEGEFYLGRRMIRVREPEIFFLLPGELHDIRPAGVRWKYHWFTLDHPQGRHWLEALGFQTRPLPAGECPSAMFKELWRLVSQGTLEGDRQAAHLAHGILLKAMEGSLKPMTAAPPGWVEDCRRAMDEKFADPTLDVNGLAHEAGVHRATLFRVFVAAHGITPSQYLQSRRVHHAMNLLKESDLSIKEIANQAGMNDANYLARLLRSMCGMAPRQFRAAHRRVQGFAR